jgi:hypothetical protein
MIKVRKDKAMHTFYSIAVRVQPFINGVLFFAFGRFLPTGNGFAVFSMHFFFAANLYIHLGIMFGFFMKRTLAYFFW